jgi:hypothetical protein
MHFGKPTSPFLLIFAALSFAISAFALYSWATYPGLPEVDQLRSASGHVTNVEEGRYGTRFALEGVPQEFNYASKGGSVELARTALTRANRPILTVWFDPQRTVGAPGTGETFYEVYQLAADGNVVRSRKDVEDAWASDMRIALWLGIFFALNGFFLANRAWKSRDAA